MFLFYLRFYFIIFGFYLLEVCLFLMTVRKRVDPTGKTGGEELGEQEKKRVLAVLAEDGSSHSAPTTGDSPGDPVPSLAPAGTHIDV